MATVNRAPMVAVRSGDDCALPRRRAAVSAIRMLARTRTGCEQGSGGVHGGVAEYQRIGRPGVSEGAVQRRGVGR